jgi:hypothetical protein
VMLLPGTNTVYVRATDGVGNVRTVRITILGSPGLSPTAPPWGQSPLALGSAAQIGLLLLVPLAAAAVGVPLVVRARRKRDRPSAGSGESTGPATSPKTRPALASRLNRFFRRRPKP